MAVAGLGRTLTGLACAAPLAAQTGRLEVVSGADPGGGEARRRWLAEQPEVAADGVEVTVCEGRSAEALVAEATRTPNAVVCIASRGRDRCGRRWCSGAGEVLRAVINDPVLLVGPRAEKPRASWRSDRRAI